jgi:hypothetical protein
MSASAGNSAAATNAGHSIRAIILSAPRLNRKTPATKFPVGISEEADTSKSARTELANRKVWAFVKNAVDKNSRPKLPDVQPPLK